MKVFITGIEGYIGTVLADELLKAGHEVAGLDAGFYREGWLYDGVKQEFSILRKDIRHIQPEDLGGFDAVVHLAELSNDPLGENNPELTYEINHHGTVNVAEKSKAAGVKRFIYFSSCSVYGASDNISDETSPTNPITAYAKCKVLNEQALRKMADENFSPVLLRNATAYGLSPRMRFDLVVNNLAGLAWTTKKIAMESDGAPWRPFVHVRDISRAVISSLNAPRKIIHNQIFNVGDNRSNYQIRDIASIVEQVFPGCEITLNKDGADKRNYRVNFDKINTTFPGFSSKEDIESGVKELLKIFKQIAMDEETFQSRHYTRLKQIKHLRDTGQVN